MDTWQVLRVRRAELGLSQSDLAGLVNVDPRQIRRYESGEAQPTLPVAAALASALGVSLNELAGEEAPQARLSGDWWAAWQTFNRGRELVNTHRLHMVQHGEVIDLTAATRGNQTVEEGGYLWRGEFRLWDNEILMGWYAGTEGAVRSKGVMYFRLHQHGQSAEGRWTGLSFDGPIITGWGAIARTEDGVAKVMADLMESDK